MKILLLSAALFVTSLGSATETPAPAAEWRTDYSAALVDARASNRAVLVNFTGTDWCVWCHRIRDEILTQPAFQDYAGDALVLVEIDFPAKKKLPGELKAQNDHLKQRFKVTGYPTLVLLSSEGEELGRLGYMQGGAKTFVRELKRLIAAGAMAPRS